MRDPDEPGGLKKRLDRAFGVVQAEPRAREPPQHLFEADARAGADLNDATRRLFQVVLELKHCPATEIRVRACHAAANHPAKNASRIAKLSRNKSQHSAVSRSC